MLSLSIIFMVSLFILSHNSYMEFQIVSEISEISKSDLDISFNMFPNQYIDLGTYGYNLAILIFIIGIIAFIFQGFISFESKKNQAGNLIMIIISLELILLSIGIILMNISVGIDDLVGVNLTLFLLPLAGAESAIALALLVAYYPLRGDISLNCPYSYKL